MQDALQFASATLMHAGQVCGALAGIASFQHQLHERQLHKSKQVAAAAGCMPCSFPVQGNRWLQPTSCHPYLPLAQQAPPKAAREEGGSEGGDAPQAGSEGAGEGGGEGDLGGGALAANSMPFVPTVDVMMLLLKGYAGLYGLRMV